jgi:hypothetical protein
MTRFLTQPIQALFERQSQGMVFGSGQSAANQSELIQADTTEIRKKISKLWG